MTSTGDKTTTVRRPHDSEATRLALLEAGRALFDEVGYDRATTREIGERAGVDPALIARYFDGKEGLFLATIAEPDGAEQIDFDPHALLEFLLTRWDERGHSPLSRALASPTLSDDVRERVCAVVGDRVLLPLSAELQHRGLPAPKLRAEILVALALGIAVTRANGTLQTLAGTPREDVIASLKPLIDALGR
jgi:AcrR family transcriptional regulator